MRASRILRLARTSRWAVVASGSTNARAICLTNPASAAWQHVNSRRRRSSSISGGVSTSCTGAYNSSGGTPLLPAGNDRSRCARDGLQPRARTIGKTIVAPRRERPWDGLLERVLGRIDVSRQPDQARQNASAFVPVQVLENAAEDHYSLSGRTSTVPSIIPGIFRSQHKAWSRFSASIR